VKNSRIQAKNAFFFDHIGQDKKLKRNIQNISRESVGHTHKRKARRNLKLGTDPFNSVDYGYKTQWKSPEYHLVSGKVGLDRTSFVVQKNDN